MEVKRVVIKAELSKEYQKAGIEMEIEGEMDEQFYPQLNFYEDLVNSEAKKQFEKLLSLVKDENKKEEPVRRNEEEEEIDESHRPTAKQIEICKKYNIPIPKTKAAASELIRRKFLELNEKK